MYPHVHASPFCGNLLESSVHFDSILRSKKHQVLDNKKCAFPGGGPLVSAISGLRLYYAKRLRPNRKNAIKVTRTQLSRVDRK